jgi:hypothetical protein
MRNILFVAILMASPFATAKGPDIDKVNGSIRTDADGQYGTLETVNGSVDVARGVRADSASTVNGRIEIDDGAVIGEVETVNGSIDLGGTVTVEHDVSTVNGAIEIERGSRIFGKLETVNGEIDMQATEVDGRIETVNGDITVGADSVVRGGILVEKPNGNWLWNGNNNTRRPPRIVIGPNAVVQGTLDFEREVELYVHSTAKIGTVRGATAKSFSGNTP